MWVIALIGFSWYCFPLKHVTRESAHLLIRGLTNPIAALLRDDPEADR